MSYIFWRMFPTFPKKKIRSTYTIRKKDNARVFQAKMWTYECARFIECYLREWKRKQVRLRSITMKSDYRLSACVKANGVNLLVQQYDEKKKLCIACNHRRCTCGKTVYNQPENYLKLNIKRVTKKYCRWKIDKFSSMI